jgi:uncharacterized protein YcbX
MAGNAGGLTVAALHRFPVKSMGGQSLDQVRIDNIGVRGDRRWMVVNAAGRYITRRELPQLARIEALPHENGVILRHAEVGDLWVSVPADGSACTSVQIWRDSLPAQLAAPEASEYLSSLLGKSLRLVYLPDTSCRPVDPAFAIAQDHVSFADGFPILVTTTESLAALNMRLANPVTMERFRPNIVVSGASAAWAEDGWRRIRIGSVELRLVKPCARCVIITQDPATGEAIDGNEPLLTLRAMGRRVGAATMFGQNAIPDVTGDVAVGDLVEVLDRGESTPLE